MPHSPAPWRVEKRPSYSPHRIYIFAADGHIIAHFQERKRGSHRGETAQWRGFMPADEANAALIGAAPTMLALLRYYVHRCPMCSSESDCHDDYCYSAREAIRQAEGAQAESEAGQ